MFSQKMKKLLGNVSSHLKKDVKESKESIAEDKKLAKKVALKKAKPKRKK